MKKVLYCVISLVLLLITSCSETYDIKGTWLIRNEDSVDTSTKVITFYEDNIWKSIDTIKISGPISTQSIVVTSNGTWEQNNDLVSILTNDIGAKGINASVKDEMNKKSYKIVKYTSDNIECYDIRDDNKKLIILRKEYSAQ